MKKSNLGVLVDDEIFRLMRLATRIIIRKSDKDHGRSYGIFLVDQSGDWQTKHECYIPDCKETPIRYYTVLTLTEGSEMFVLWEMAGCKTHVPQLKQAIGRATRELEELALATGKLDERRIEISVPVDASVDSSLIHEALKKFGLLERERIATEREAAASAQAQAEEVARKKEEKRLRHQNEIVRQQIEAQQRRDILKLDPKTRIEMALKDLQDRGKIPGYFLRSEDGYWIADIRRFGKSMITIYIYRSKLLIDVGKKYRVNFPVDMVQRTLVHKLEGKLNIPD